MLLFLRQHLGIIQHCNTSLSIFKASKAWLTLYPISISNINSLHIDESNTIQGHNQHIMSHKVSEKQNIFKGVWTCKQLVRLPPPQILQIVYMKIRNLVSKYCTEYLNICLNNQAKRLQKVLHKYRYYYRIDRCT